MIIEVAIGVFVGLICYHNRAALFEIAILLAGFAMVAGLTLFAFAVAVGLPIWIIAAAGEDPKNKFLQLGSMASMLWLFGFGWALMSSIWGYLTNKFPKLAMARNEATKPRPGFQLLSVIFFSTLIAVVPTFLAFAAVMFSFSMVMDIPSWAGVFAIPIWVGFTYLIARRWFRYVLLENSKEARMRKDLAELEKQVAS